MTTKKINTAQPSLKGKAAPVETDVQATLDHAKGDGENGPTEAATVVSLDLVKGGKVSNIFTMQASDANKDLAAKAQLLSDAKQRLAHAFDLFSQGGDTEKEATTEADRAARALYQARITGLISLPEETAILGDIFGWKMKGAGNSKTRVTTGDPNASKSPFGRGDSLRKRIDRAVKATEFVTTGTGDRFFEGLDSGDVAGIVEDVKKGETSMYRAYDLLQELKRGRRETVAVAFDPKRIAGIVASLSEDGAADMFVDNPALVAAYSELLGVLNVVGQAAAQKQAA